MADMESRLVTRAFWGLVGWGVPLIVVFFVTPPLLHALGVERFGVLMTVFIAPVIAVHLDFGLVTVGMRRVAFRLLKERLMLQELWPASHWRSALLAFCSVLH